MGIKRSDLVLDIRQAVKIYGNKIVLNELSLRAVSGECTTILGPNGAGKTTLIECCEGLRRLDQGAIRVLGENPAFAGPQFHARVGVMLQDSGLPSGAKALETLLHVKHMYRNPRDHVALAERLGITKFATTTVRRLSGGQRQRLAMACAIVGQPELVFLDEPTAGMDIESRAEVWQIVRELKADGVSIVLTTHDMNEAMHLSDQIAIINDGQVIEKDNPEALLRNHVGTDQRVQLTFDRKFDSSGLPLELTGDSVYELREPLSNTVLQRILQRAETHAATLLDLQRTKLTLEDVFLQLTGRELK